MHDEVAFDDVERFLLDAPILSAAAFARHGAHRSFLLVLAGAVSVLAKPADTIDNGDVIVGREAAAWTLARELGWADLMGATVRRVIDSPETGRSVAASLQVVWSDVRPVADIGLFNEDDTRRAAVFDAVVAHEDRMNNNWLLVPDSGAQPPRLKLIDHGYAFGPGLKEPNSSFYQLHRGADIEEEIVNRLRRLTDPRHSRDLGDLLAPDEFAGVQARAWQLAETRRLQL